MKSILQDESPYPIFPGACECIWNPNDMVSKILTMFYIVFSVMPKCKVV